MAMEESIEIISQKKPFTPGALVKIVTRLWERTINIGLTDKVSDFDKKRVRLINGISSWVVVIYFGYVIVFAGKPEAKFVFYECVVGLVAGVCPLIFNYYRRYNLACHFFNIFNLFFYLFESVAEGGRDGVEYIFVPLCAASMLFFRSRRVVFTYFVVTFLFFSTAKISHRLMKPFFTWEGQHGQIFANWATMFIILFLIVFYFKTENERQEELLEKKNVSLGNEKQKSDNLLMNILPHDTAEELKSTGSAKSRSFEIVTVMFTDFRDFTSAAESMHPEELVAEIHGYFTMFDKITSKYNIEKIKTIGDSYMCAGGLPEKNITNPADVIMAALEIQQFMNDKKAEKQRENKLFFECRLGIHTGPVIAGIVGTKKFAYDIWGDTVNIASRMESCGLVGKVNISGGTYQYVKDQFRCSYRGKVAAKNKGEIDMYFVEGLPQPVENNIA
jgi:class 3 adenylate cyclase